MDELLDLCRECAGLLDVASDAVGGDLTVADLLHEHVEFRAERRCRFEGLQRGQPGIEFGERLAVSLHRGDSMAEGFGRYVEDPVLILNSYAGDVVFSGFAFGGLALSDAACVLCDFGGRIEGEALDGQVIAFPCGKVCYTGGEVAGDRSNPYFGRVLLIGGSRYFAPGPF